ncbi:VCBS repeat-containing protein, partial [Oxalobacteraceae bacterium OM1]
MQLQLQPTSTTSHLTVSIAPPDNGPSGLIRPVTGDPRSIQAADMNGDGYLDIFIAPSYYNQSPALSPIVLLNDGHGKFHDGTKSVFGTLPVIQMSDGVFFKSFTNDGRMGMFVTDQGLEIGDAYVGGFKGAINQFWLQDKNGVFQNMTASIPSNAPAFNHVSSVADVNGDGNLDVVVTRMGGPAVEGQGTFFYLGDGKGGFTFSTAGLPAEISYKPNNQIDWSSKTIDYQFSGSAGTGDLGGTGRLDLVAGSYTNGDQVSGKQTVRVYQHNADNTFSFASQTTEPEALTSAVGAMGVAGITSGDINGDGRNDLVIHWEVGAKSAIQILENEGNYQFKDVTLSAMGSYLLRDAQQQDGAGNWQTLASSYFLQDVNHDGKLDIVLNDNGVNAAQMAQGLSSGAFIYLNDGAGHFTPAQFAAANGTPLTAEQLSTMTGQPAWGFGFPLTFDADNDGNSDYVFIADAKNADGTTALDISTLFGANSGATYLAGDTGGTLMAGSGNATFVDGRGSDTFKGSIGRDTAIYSSPEAGYQIARGATGYTVTSRANGVHDMLTGVERVRFSDTAVALDIDGNAGQAYRLYQAAF